MTQRLPRHRALLVGQGAPLRRPAPVLARRNPTCSSRRAMQDRSVGVRVDDLVVGHVVSPWAFIALILNGLTLGHHATKPEIV